MFKLTSLKNPEVVYVIVGGKKYSVGRRTGVITFPDDTSVSRNHAEVELDHPKANVDNPSLLPTLNVTDVGSKFGTFVCTGGGEELRQISMRETESLMGGDRVRFGRQWNDFKVEYTPLIVTSSTLKDDEQKVLKDVLWKLGGHYSGDWIPTCNFVVMNAVTLTTKAVCALLSGNHIVTPNYFHDLCFAAESGMNVDMDPKDFEPPFAETMISPAVVDLRPNPARNKLFEKKLFLLANSRQRKKIGAAIKAGGGSCKLISECTRQLLQSRDTIIVQPPSDFKLQEVSDSIATYKSQGKRFIQESEIGLAAVYVSVTKHCNPFASYAEQIFPPMNTQTQQQSQLRRDQVIVPETQSQMNKSAVDPNAPNVVEESFNISLDAEGVFPPDNNHSKVDVKLFVDNSRPGTSKRTKSNAEEEELPSAKRRFETETAFPDFDSEPATKKQKGASVSKNETKVEKAQKTLSALFNMSDSEDEDDNLMVVSETLPEEPKMDSHNENNLNTRTSSSRKKPSQPAGEPFVDFIPGTPEASDDECDLLAGLRAVEEAEAKSSSQRNKRKIETGDDDDDISVLPTAKIPTIPIEELPTVPVVVEPKRAGLSIGKASAASQNKASTSKQTNLSQWLSGSKRKTPQDDSPDIAESTKKIKTETVFDDIPVKMEKMNIKNEKDFDMDMTAFVPAPVKVTSLIREKRLDVKSVSVNGGPNFKKFRKVQPLFPHSVNTGKKNGRSFITVEPNKVSDEFLERLDSQRSLARSEMQENQLQETTSRQQGSSHTRTAGLIRAHESVVVEVDVDVNAINTPSQIYSDSNGSGNAIYDPSDGLFDF